MKKVEVKEMKENNEKLQLSYYFFKDKAEKNEQFCIKEIAEKTKWNISTVRTYIGKKWKPFLVNKGSHYYINKVKFTYSEEEYLRMMSQVQRYSSNPYKPDLEETVEELVNKAREAAILSIDIYNRPMTVFRTQGFTVMMIIAWTSLLHAIFEKLKINYFYYDSNSCPVIIDGDKKAWELSKCIEEYKELSNAVKENIKMFISLRNKIEHRFAPLFDLDICGECQALLLNFEELITKDFGIYYSLNTTLSIPMQLINTRPDWKNEIIKQVQSRHYNELKQFIDDYRSGLSDEIYLDNKYCFRVYLIPKVGNHRSSSDKAIEFIKYDPSQPESFINVEKEVTLIKEKTVQVANQGYLKPSDVCKKVKEQIDRDFKINLHTKAWKYYKVRKKGHQAAGCKTEFCHYDEPHKDYIYTKKWVDFLVEKLKDDQEYENIKLVR